MAVANILAYYVRATIIAVKSFLEQAYGLKVLIFELFILIVQKLARDSLKIVRLNFQL
jgi:hypothetical protein